MTEDEDLDEVDTETCPKTGLKDCGCGDIWHFDGDFEAWVRWNAEWGDE